MFKFDETDIQSRRDFFRKEAHAEPFLIKPGTIPVMVSAPHSVKQTRNGKTKSAEYETGTLALLLNEQGHCPCIVKTRNSNDDANFDAVSTYKDALAEYIRENDIRYLIDLHQMAITRGELIDIGTGRGRNIHGRTGLAEEIKRLFLQQGIPSVNIDSVFRALNKNTVSATISRTCHIPCFQIEMNSRLLRTEYPAYCFEKVFETLYHIINYLSGE